MVHAAPLEGFNCGCALMCATDRLLLELEESPDSTSCWGTEIMHKVDHNMNRCHRRMHALARTLASTCTSQSCHQCAREVFRITRLGYASCKLQRTCAGILDKALAFSASKNMGGKLLTLESRSSDAVASSTLELRACALHRIRQ